MKKSFLRVIALVLTICAMQVALVPAVSAETLQTAEYDFYEPCKNYSYVYHYNTSSTTAQSTIASQFDSETLNWKVESFSSYANVVRKSIPSIQGESHIVMLQGTGAYTAFRLRSPGTGEYSVDLNYVVRNTTTTYDSDGKMSTRGANAAAEITIVPATQDSYTNADISALAAQNRAQLRVSCYDASASKPTIKTATFNYSFLENNDYLLIVRGGPSYGDSSTYGETYLRSLDVTRVGDYVAPEAMEYARPVTILEEALALWDDGFCIAAEVNGEDYLAVPVNGGKMYIFNLDTWQLVNEVNTGIGTPRGITVDDNGVIYLVGASYYIYKYDLKTNQSSKSSNVNISGVSMGSLYDLRYGDDGNLYTGTDNGHIIRYNPNTDTVTAIFAADCGISDATYVSSVIQDGQYIYAAVTNKTFQHYLLKLDKDTHQVVGTVEYTSTKPATYMSYMSITSDGIILGTANNLMAVDTETMTLLTAEEFGSDAQAQCYVSEAINGKHYFVSSTDRCMYCYDPQATDGNKVTKMLSVGQYFDCQGKTVTFDRDGDGKDEKYLIALENANSSDVTFVSPETGKSFKLGIWELLPENAGAGTGVNSLTSGVAGSNELYYGGFLSDEVFVYNTQEGKITQKIQASGIQTDAICVYNGNIYAGNYTEAQLTKLNRTTNKPEVLFTLHNSLFNQSRIHSIAGGDNKVFVGTFPYVYAYGGTIAWYDLTNSRTYVAVGPNPEDVYYSDNNTDWYNEQAGGDPVTAITGTANDGIDGVDGVVTNQGIKEVAYHNGILYAATSRSGGTNTSYAANTSAVIIAYDVAARQVIATFDPTTQGFGSPVPTISGIELDEDGNLWCIVSETLFTLTLNGNTFTYNEKISFDKYSYDTTQNRNNSDIRFKDGYAYAALERIGGLCKVNMTNPSEYTLLMPNVTSNGQVPENFAFGEDGNLYYLHGTALKMLPLDDTEDEWTAADAVTAQISAITSDSTSEEIAQVRAAYDALTLREKSLVQNYDVLVQAEADALMADINALGEITWEKKEQVQALLAIYQAMPMSQQNLITNYYVLSSANQKLLMLESNAPVVAVNNAGEETYYQTLEDALAVVTEGTIQLRGDVTAEEANMKADVVLDLNGFTLTIEAIVGTVMDSADGEGLIKTDMAGATLKSSDNQLILWDNATENSGYRVFNYTLINMGEDVKNNDSAESENCGAAVKSFWSDLSFTNPYAYTLIASTNSSLQVGYEVSWTPDGGEATTKTFTFNPNVLEAWANAEEANVDNAKNYCFYMRLTGFEELRTDGVVTVKPVLTTRFNTAEAEQTQVTINYKDYGPGELEFEVGFGDLADRG